MQIVELFQALQPIRMTQSLAYSSNQAIAKKATTLQGLYKEY